MTELAQYLMTNYYSKYKGNRLDVVPSLDELEIGLKNHPEKIVIIKDKKIRGIGIFLTLTDESFDLLTGMDITNVEILKALIPEQGPHLHFVLLAADSLKTILLGLKQTLSRLNPKTVSWFEPDMSMLHIYRRRK